MRGHEKLIEIRRRGLVPSGLVYLHDDPVKPSFLEWANQGGAPTICTNGDGIDFLDLRFVVGLKVNVCGEDPKRVRRIAGACKKAGAALVVANSGERYALWKQGDAKWHSF